jgi:uncharacterized protein (DUF697 family)
MSDTTVNEPPPHEQPKVVETAEAPDRVLLAHGVLRRMSMWSAGAGVIPVPGIDLAVIVGLQVKTVRELALIYGVPFDEVRTKAIIASIIGGLLPFNAAVGVGGLAATLYKAIPGVGAVLGMITMPAAAAAANYTLGRLFIEHFESGGTLLDFNAEKMRARFRAEQEDPNLRRAAA